MDDLQPVLHSEGFPGGSVVKESASNAGDVGLIPGLGRPPGEGNGTPLQYSCLENSMDRGPRQATVHGVAKESDMTEWLNNSSEDHSWEKVSCRRRRPSSP